MEWFFRMLWVQAAVYDEGHEGGTKRDENEGNECRHGFVYAGLDVDQLAFEFGKLRVCVLAVFVFTRTLDVQGRLPFFEAVKPLQDGGNKVCIGQWLFLPSELTGGLIPELGNQTEANASDHLQINVC